MSIRSILYRTTTRFERGLLDAPTLAGKDPAPFFDQTRFLSKGAGDIEAKGLIYANPPNQPPAVLRGLLGPPQCCRREEKNSRRAAAAPGRSARRCYGTSLLLERRARSRPAAQNHLSGSI